MSATDVQAICLWSGPRNVSTALMYSFAQLDGIRVVDEPLYGHYLRVSRAIHPGGDEVMAAMNCDGDAVMRELLEEQQGRPTPRLFIKHMAHHLVDIDLGFTVATMNLFLIRDPHEMLPSLTVQVPHAGLVDTGLKRQWELFEMLAERGQSPLVLDSRELLLDPASVLRQLCASINIPYSDDMLSWQAGGRAEDGVWAPHWYHAVHRSTGFQPYREKATFPQELAPLLELCRPWYERLYEHAIRRDSCGDGQ